MAYDRIHLLSLSLCGIIAFHIHTVLKAPLKIYLYFCHRTAPHRTAPHRTTVTARHSTTAQREASHSKSEIPTPPPVARAQQAQPTGQEPGCMTGVVRGRSMQRCSYLCHHRRAIDHMSESARGMHPSPTPTPTNPTLFRLL
jgi:hypothetical protein